MMCGIEVNDMLLGIFAYILAGAIILIGVRLALK